MNDKIMMKRDIVIIGGGPAGLAAALAAKKEGAESILILERDKELGGVSIMDLAFIHFRRN